ncbi:MAG: AMP-binding protein [Bauldia sp.]|nr:AMP-binding protein [Bauldia sp.]
MSATLTGPPAAPGSDAPATLADAIRGMAPETVLVEIDASGRRRTGIHAELLERSLTLEPALRAISPDRQSQVVVCADSLLDYLVAAGAAVFAGVDILPWQMSRTGEANTAIAVRLALVRRLSRPALVTTSRIAAILGDRLDAFPGGVVLLDRPGSAPAPAGPDAGAAPRDGSFLVATSGTTGDPKLAVIRHRTVLDRSRLQNERLAGRVGFNLAPLDTAGGTLFLYRTAPTTIWMHPERFAARPLEALAAIADLGADAIGLSSSLAAIMLDALDRTTERFDLRSLTIVAFGAEMIVPDIVRRLTARLREMGAAGVKVAFNYGSTEVGGMTRTADLDPFDMAVVAPGGAPPPPVGSAQPGVSIRVVGDHGETLSAGMVGAIEVSSPIRMFDGYLGEPEATAASFTADGWLKTGDRGVVRDGALTIVGRGKATIIVNGRNIALEAIEGPLRMLAGIDRAMVAAVPVRGPSSHTDELAVFFVPVAAADDAVAALARTISGEAARASGVAPRHLVPVPAAEFPLTATGKVRRDALLDAYLAGRWTPVGRQPQAAAASAGLAEVEARLAAIWRAVLNLTALPGPRDDFFELGGDSLASSELVLAIEEAFGRDVAPPALFAVPTLAAMAAVVAGDGAAATDAETAPEEAPVLPRLTALLASWRGARAFPEALLVGSNLHGTRKPVFWVFQTQAEFEALGEAVGPDQPLYGMRSLASVGRYSAGNLDALTDRYMWELLVLAPRGDIIVGGNCQGGVVALELARKLMRVHRAPSPLILMEWEFERGFYDQPVHFLYGRESHTAAVFGEPQTAGPDWRTAFPNHAVGAIAGGHGEYFTAANVPVLAAAIAAITRGESSAAVEALQS